ncbi:BCL2/adenovirus E1B 19 kDa protein-interacting protein 2-like isoform X2 [Platichthys flesus]|uniref:BCL2/adenovirus E1B 19 kDa protein-interacting protein 2-like isoform X2 n=1 Tax=Platichthys flesus TaxID=8260 RepID=UPI002DBC7F87|nr:BCL2/adenovirus E1B 19 kDa protein-interacting protein 2-like isoform X2 [Platichthys flesus]
MTDTTQSTDTIDTTTTDTTNTTTAAADTCTTTTNTTTDITTTDTTTVAACCTSATTTTSPDEPDEEETERETPTDEEKGDDEQLCDVLTGATEDESQQKSSTATRDKPDPPSTLLLSGLGPKKKRVLAAPALSLSLGRSESTVSDDFPSGFLSPSPEDHDDTGLDLDLDGMETPSDSESLLFPIYDLDLEDDLRRLGVASHRHQPIGTRPVRSDLSELGALEREDVVDSQGTRWRCFSTGDPPQESRVDMSVLEPFLRVLSHGGYYGDGMNDIIVFSSCYLPQNRLKNYTYVMDNLFRYVVGTLDLMVAENYVMVYLCAGGQRDKLPEFSWLRECYTTVHRRLRKNLKGFHVVHPTWYIKALITIIKPFIRSVTLLFITATVSVVNSTSCSSLPVPQLQVQQEVAVRQQSSGTFGFHPDSTRSDSRLRSSVRSESVQVKLSTSSSYPAGGAPVLREILSTSSKQC